MGVVVSSDTWKGIGIIPVYEFAGILGTVRGLPTGSPLVGATVSLCSIFGTPYGSCGSSVPTNASGAFFLSTPPAAYILVVTALGHDPDIRVSAVLAKPFRLADLLAQLAPKTGSIQIRPVHPFADAPASRVLVRAVKTGRAPLKLLPPLVLHERGGAKHTAEAEAILRGEADLPWL